MVNLKYNHDEILAYLKTHTYKETSAFFNISEMQISRIKKKNNIESTKNPQDFKDLINLFNKMLIELEIIITKYKKPIEKLMDILNI